MKIAKSGISKTVWLLTILVIVTFAGSVITNCVIGGLNRDLAYRNYADHVPAGYSGPEFAMLDDYPSVHPGPANYKWLSVDVDFEKGIVDNDYSAEWQEYIGHVVDYVKENVKATGGSFEVSPGWYTFPWLSANPHSGREFTHGARYSFPVGLNHFVPTAPAAKKVSVWASSYINKYGGYVLGQMWSEDGYLNYEPNDDHALSGLPWPNGTVMTKINFISNIQVKDLKSSMHLKGAPAWTLHTHKYGPSSPEENSNERILQSAYPLGLDISIRDNRSPTGWLYLTLKYDQAKREKATGPIDNLWDVFTLTGFIFGNDPKTYPAVSESESLPLHQSYIAPLSYQWHLGCNGRLENLIGTAQQSCIGCHATASFVKDDPAPRAYDLMYPSSCDPGNWNNGNDAYYFEASKYPTPYPGPQANPGKPVSLDYVLRLYDAIAAYSTYGYAW